MSLQPRRRALLVTGMHRSGTSCLTRIINLTGVAIGTDLLPTQPDNPAGFWEHAALGRLNEEILTRLGTRWDALAPLPDQWWMRSELDELKQDLREILRRDFADAPDLVIKDPRLSLLVPLWREVLSELGIAVEFLIVTRHVQAVADSLHSRNAFADWQSQLLWLRYTLSIELETREDRRSLVRYEDLLEDWRAALGKVIGTIALDLPAPGSERAEAIDAFIAPQLNHAHSSPRTNRAETSPWAQDVMEALAHPGSLEDADSRKTLDRVRQEFLAADALHAPQDQHWRNEYLRLKQEVVAAEEGQQNAESAHERLRGSLEILGFAPEEVRGNDHRNGHQPSEEGLGLLAKQTEAARRATEQLIEERGLIRELSERIASLEAHANNRSEEDWNRLSEDRDRLSQQVITAETERNHLQDELALAHRRQTEKESQVAALSENLNSTGAQLSTYRSEAEQEIARTQESLHATQAQLLHTQSDLENHRQALGNLLTSRSWQITKPIRDLKNLLGRGQVPVGAVDLQHPVPWHELLPGRPFRQQFRVPQSELAGLAIGFFNYGRTNTTSVRLRLFEERGALRSNLLLEEMTLRGADIQDGGTSLFPFSRRLRDAQTRSFVIEIESLDGRTGETVTVALGHAAYPGKILSRDRRKESPTRGLLVLEMLAQAVAPKKAVAFISGCPGGAYRYRCEHPAEMLRLRGYSVDVIPADTFPWAELLSAYQVVVAHRVPHTPEFENFVAEAATRGVRVLFDTDDLIFAPEIEDQIAALDDLPPDERKLWLDGVQRYRHSLSLMSEALVSTPGLKESLESRLNVKASVARNRVTTQMVNDANAVLKSRPLRPSDGHVRIGYMSGTPTHRRDFAECVPGLATVMERHPLVRLMLVGHIEIPDALTTYADRIDFQPLVPWQELPEIYARLDISLAPLERENEFTIGKSELKYFEAGLLRIPTVASRIGSYIDAIRDGENGFLCDSDEEWTDALETLVLDAERRQAMGAAAHDDVHRRYTTRAAASKTVETLIDTLGERSLGASPLRVAMVLRAPIANTGGGYKKIFHLVEHLSNKGHEVTVYVEPIAHLEGRDEAFIEAFCREHFACGDAKIRVGNNAIAECDVAIATNWPTAPVVSDLENARLRLYFIQDDEAEFYPVEDPNRLAAASTYTLPLLMVGIGRYLSRLIGERNQLSYPHVDFALGEAFFEEREAVEAKLNRQTTQEPLSLLFFARPGIPRRAFELGVEALTLFQRSRPDVEIRLYGLDEPQELPFKFTDLGVIDHAAVAAEMRRADIHLSFSRTNASTVIFEAMASGTVAVELDVESVRALIEDPDSCVLCDDSPEAVATQLTALCNEPERRLRIARTGFESVTHFTVENMCQQFEDILLAYSLSDRSRP